MAAVATGISLSIGLGQSLWFDEIYSVLLAEHSWREIISLTAEDVHPPLYYLLLKAWMSLFGDSDLAIRSLSAVFLGLSVAGAGLLARRLFGAKTALLMLPFVVFAPFLLRYGFEVRMYSFVSFIGVASSYVLVRLVDENNKTNRRRLAVAYSLLVLAGMYSLYFMALVWLAHLAWVAWLAYKDRNWQIIKPAVVAYTGAFMLFLPWLCVFISNLISSQESTISPVTHSLSLDNLIGIVTFLFLYRPPWWFSAGVVATIIGVIVSVIYLGVSAYKKASGEERRYLGLLLAYFMVPVVALVIITQPIPIYLERYVAHFAIGGYMALGVAAALLLRRGILVQKIVPAFIGVVLLAGCYSLAQYGNFNFQRLHTPSVASTVPLLDDCKNGTVIYAAGPQIFVELGYYIKDCPVRFFNQTHEMTGGFAMFSGSPMWVADGSTEFAGEDKLLYVYYDEEQRALPSDMVVTKVETAGPIHVATYERIGVN